RVPSGLRVHRGGEDVGNLEAGRVREEPRGCGLVETLELEQLRVRGEIGERGREPVVCADLGVAVGDDEHDPVLSDLASEKACEMQGRGVGPMHVLEDDEPWSLPGSATEQLGDRLEELEERLLAF